MIRLSAKVLTLSIPLLGLPVSACHSLTFFYSADAIEGRVVDAETGKALDGVITVAHWQLKGGFEGGNPVGELKILESVTDQSGRYFFPGWGPTFAATGYLDNYSPKILFFKPGYKFLRVSNDHWYPGRDMSKSDWNGRTVKLEWFRGWAEEYAKHLGRLSGELWGIGHEYEPCGWKSFPRLILALHAQDAEFRRAGINYGSVASQLRSNDLRLRAAGCGSIEEILRP